MSGMNYHNLEDPTYDANNTSDEDQQNTIVHPLGDSSFGNGNDDNVPVLSTQLYPKSVDFPEWDSLAEKHRQTDAQTYFAFFKAFVGSGILFLAAAFAQAGLATAIVSFIVTTILSTICMLKMAECKNRMVQEFKSGNDYGIRDTHQVIGFGMVGRAAAGPAGRYMINICIGLSQLCFCSSYLIFCGKNLQSVIMTLHNCVSPLSQIDIIWILLPLLIPITFLRQLKKLKIGILIADLCIVIGLIYLYYRNIKQIVDHGFGEGIIQFDGKGFWPFLGTALYALEGTAFILPIEHSMTNRDHFPRVTTISGLAVGGLYMSFGLIGYLAFGAASEPIILLNLKNNDPTDISIVVLQLAYCVALFFSFPLQMFPSVKIFESYLFDLKKKSVWITALKNLLRIVLACLCALLASVGGQSFGNFVSLIGGLVCVPLTLVFPAWFHQKICGDRLSNSQKVFNYIIILVGLVGTIACTYVSLDQWINPVASTPDSCIAIN